MKIFRAMAIRQTEQRGFILPTVLLLSIGMFIIGLALVQATTSSGAGLEGQYTSLLAREASDGGIAYANYCYNLTGSQTWGTAGNGPLTQQTDCNGTVCNGSNVCKGVSGMKYQQYYQTTKNYKTSFSVGDVTQRANGALLIASVGSVNEVASGNASLILRTTTYTQRQILFSLLPKASKSASGSYKTCGIVSNTLYCWGKNSILGSEDFRGNLGNNNTTDSTKPVKVLQENNVLLGHTPTDIVSADYHSCAIADGDAYCWGNNAFGQLGNGSAVAYSAKPVKVTNTAWGGNGLVKAIGADGSTTCVVAGASNKIYCWGDNSDGQDGQNSNTTAFYNAPVQVKDQSSGAPATGLPSGYSATAMHTSGSSAHNLCAIANGAAYCWGKNDHGQIGDGTKVDRYVPTAVSTSGVLAGKTITAISVDGVYSGVYAWPHACAIANGNVYCWGNNSASKYGSPLSMMGNGDTSTADYLTPTPPTTSGVLNGRTIVGLNVGERHTCVLADNQKMYCWGANSVGELGALNGGTNYGPGGSSNPDSSVPVQTQINGPSGDLNFTGIGGGSNRACGIANYKTYCWGNNNQGQIGDGTTNNARVPTLSLFLQPASTYFLF